MAEQLQMPVGLGEVEWTDIFAGAGGSSLGLELVPGMRVTQALNHWDLAVEAHNANFPFADHDVHDVQEIPASRFRRTRCLWASPDCTHHAYCRGPKADDPEAQRSRSTFNDIVRFTAHHRYDAVTTAPAQHMLVQVNRGAKNGKDGRSVSSIDEPTRTVAGHGELALVALCQNANVQPADAPAPTVTGGGNHHGLLVYNGVPGFVRDLGDAAGTVTGRDKQSLLVPYYGTGVAHDTREPAGIVTSKDRHALVITDADVDACLFRMLQWHELLRAQQMHQHGDGRPYELTARRRDARGRMRELSNEQRVKMIGNAVSSPVAAMLGAAVAEILRDAA